MAVIRVVVLAIVASVVGTMIGATAIDKRNGSRGNIAIREIREAAAILDSVDEAIGTETIVVADTEEIGRTAIDVRMAAWVIVVDRVRAAILDSVDEAIDTETIVVTATAAIAEIGVTEIGRIAAPVIVADRVIVIIRVVVAAMAESVIGTITGATVIDERNGSQGRIAIRANHKGVAILDSVDEAIDTETIVVTGTEEIGRTAIVVRMAAWVIVVHRVRVAILDSVDKAIDTETIVVTDTAEMGVTAIVVRIAATVTVIGRVVVAAMAASVVGTMIGATVIDERNGRRGNIAIRAIREAAAILDSVGEAIDTETIARLRKASQVLVRMTAMTHRQDRTSTGGMT